MVSARPEAAPKPLITKINLLSLLVYVRRLTTLKSLRSRQRQTTVAVNLP